MLRLALDLEVGKSIACAMLRPLRLASLRHIPQV